MKKTIILSMIIVSMLQVGCRDKNKENIDNNQVYTEEVESQEKIEEISEENYTVFNSLDNVYEKNQDITVYENGGEIFNNITDIPYERGRYMEVDYANDFIEKYLYGDESIYDYLVTIDNKYENGYIKSDESEKERVRESLKFLREQMYLTSEDPVYFRLSRVTYGGQVDGLKNSIVLNVSGHISADNINFLSLSKFTITIVPEKDKLLVNII